MNFRHLAQPCRIGSLEIKNRMAVTAMGVNLAEADGSCGDKIIAFHERQAKGGAGLIILGVPGVAWPDGGNQPRQIAISEDRHIPGLKTMAEAIHVYDAKVIAQIHHGGMVSAQDMKEGRPVWIPSYPKPADMDLFDHMLPHEMNAFFDPEAPPINMHVMTKEDIEILIAKYAAAAARAKEAGIDGVEIHAGHGYMISGFLSPSSNTREDEYGGKLHPFREGAHDEGSGVVRVSVASEIERHHAILLAERLCQVIPPMRVGPAPVQESNHGSRTLAPGEGV